MSATSGVIATCLVTHFVRYMNPSPQRVSGIDRDVNSFRYLGKRVLVQRKMVSALGMARGGSSKGGGDRLAHFVSGKAISTYINKELQEVIQSPSLFRTAKGNKAYCYEATVLADICDAVLEAKKGKLIKKGPL